MSRASLILLLAFLPQGGSTSPHAPPPLRVIGAFDASPRVFAGPRSVAAGPDGLLYVADTGRHRVRVFGPDGVPRRDWGGFHELRFPSGIAVAPDGRVVVADTGHHRVRVFDPQGRPLLDWPAVFPAAVAAAADRVAVVEPDFHRVRLFNARGELLRTIGGFGEAPGRFNAPSDAAFGDGGRLYVSDANNHRIQVFDGEGRPVAAWGSWGVFSGFFNRPGGLAFAHGRLYVADTGNHRIQVFDPEGRLRHQWGAGAVRPHQAEGRLHGPSDIAVAPGFAVLCEPLEDRLQLFPPGDVAGPRVIDSPWHDRGHTRAAAPEPGASPPSRAGPARTPETAVLAAAVEPDAHAVFFVDVTRNTASRLIARGGGFGPRLGQFNRPEAAAFDPARLRAYVSDRGHRRIQVLELSRDPSRPFGAGGRVRAIQAFDFPKLAASEHAVPGALALDAQGRLYVVDPSAPAVIVFNERMEILRTLRPPADAPPPRWEAVAPSPDGSRIYVADAFACRILAFDAAGKLLHAWGAPGETPEAFLMPSGLAVDAQGFVHVADALLHEIKTFAPDGTFVRRAGGSGTGPGKLRAPGGMAFWPPCHVYVDDAGNHLGQLFTLDGKSSGFFLKTGFPLPGTVK